MDTLLDCFELAGAESGGVMFFRRLFTIHWLYVPNRRLDHIDVPPRQAHRLVDLLG
jgi:hypothetical protein